jgi:hypothetical protein
VVRTSTSETKDSARRRSCHRWVRGWAGEASDEIDRGLTAFARSPNSGLIVTASALAVVHRDLIITLAARLRLPAVYYDRYFVTTGSYGSNGSRPRVRVGVTMVGAAEATRLAPPVFQDIKTQNHAPKKKPRPMFGVHVMRCGAQASSSPGIAIGEIP